MTGLYLVKQAMKVLFFASRGFRETEICFAMLGANIRTMPLSPQTAFRLMGTNVGIVVKDLVEMTTSNAISMSNI